MSDITPLIPRQPVPPLSVPLAGGGEIDLETGEAERFTLSCSIAGCVVRDAANG